MSERILIVEDEFLVAADLQDSLERLGYTVVGTADDAQQAIELAHDEKPDLALLDVRIRGHIDGIDLSAQLDIPFVFLTAHADAATLDRAGDKAPFGYLLKPFDERELQATIAMAMRRYRADQDHKKMARWLSTTMECLGEGVIACDAEGRTTFINTAAQRMTGWPRREALGQLLHDILDLGTNQPRPAIDQLYDKARSERIVVHFQGELPPVASGSRPLPVAGSFAPIKEGSSSIGVVALLRDRTTEVEEEARQREVEGRIREAQRLQSVGVLAGGVAHHFNELWQTVMRDLNLARHNLPPDSAVLHQLARIEEIGEHGTNLSNQLLAFSGRSVPRPEELELNRFVLDNVELLRVLLPGEAELILALDEQPQHIRFDRGQLQQVLVGLVHNAGDALLGNPGTVTLSTSRTTVTELRHTLRGGVGLRGDECAVLSVIDSGTGIADDVLPSIFDPFFSTRGPTRGLELAAIDGIVRNHHAAIGVRSQLGKGSTFNVYFSNSELDTVRNSPTLAYRASRVLVADDDSSVRATLGAILTDWGAIPELCSSGLEAIAAVSRASWAYDLALIDLTMPEMNGLETGARLRALAPQLKVGLMSGYDDTSAMSAFGEHGLNLYIRKPFSRKEVRSKLESALPGNGGETRSSVF